MFAIKMFRVLEKIINSKKFIFILKKYPKYLRAHVLGLFIEFFCFFEDEELSFDYMKKLRKIPNKRNYLNGNYWDIGNYKLDMYNDLYIKKYPKDTKADMLTYFFKKKYFYHSFNPYFRNILKKEGFNPSLDLFKKEINSIEKIFAKVGIYNIFGFFNLNCKNKLSFSDNFQSLYKYSLTSPEWFNSFTCEGAHVFLNNVYKNAYKEKKYNKCLANVSTMLKFFSKNNKDLFIKRANKLGFANEILLKLNRLLEEKNKDKISFYELIDKDVKIRKILFNKNFDLNKRSFLFMYLYNKFLNINNKNSSEESLSENEFKKVIDFFDLCWSRFGSYDYQVVAIVKRNEIVKNYSYKKLPDLILSKYPDFQIDKKIDKKNVNFIKLPSFKKIMS
ncbi:hypothetical protein EOL94_01815 [bacterium]|nr:hypothetical protein [bacterium]